LVGFGFACLAGVADFFAVFLFDCRNGFVFQIDEFGLQLKRILGAFLDAFTAATAQVRVNYDVIFA
jgi:hypothetical protein